MAYSDPRGFHGPRRPDPFLSVDERIIHTPALLCVEVLSPRDTLKAMRRRIQDFLDLGVPTVWILDPATRTACTCTVDTITEQTTGTLHAESTPLEVGIEDLFATLDR